MPSQTQPDGKNSLLGEFLVALARAPEPIQEAIILYGLKAMHPLADKLIYPYPMMSHLLTIVDPKQKSSKGSPSGDVDY